MLIRRLRFVRLMCERVKVENTPTLSVFAHKMQPCRANVWLNDLDRLAGINMQKLRPPRYSYATPSTEREDRYSSIPQSIADWLLTLDKRIGHESSYIRVSENAAKWPAKL